LQWKFDFKKEYKELYIAQANRISLVSVPKFNFLMIDGHGDPNISAQFQQAMDALFSVSYTIKFMLKKGGQQIDYGVMPLEGLWWTDNSNNFWMQDKALWNWTIMIMQPEFVTSPIIEQGTAQAGKRKYLPMLSHLRLEAMNEGLCAQVLHIGPYDKEPPTIQKLHAFIKDNGYKLNGKHREIYLSDVRRAAPDKLKTIIRQPICK